MIRIIVLSWAALLCSATATDRTVEKETQTAITKMESTTSSTLLTSRPTDDTQPNKKEFYPQILNTSRCEWTGHWDLRCMCISEGSSLPTIKWPELENRDTYSVVTKVKNNTVQSIITVTLENLSYTNILCVSGESQANLSISTRDLLNEVLSVVKTPHFIITFLTGMLLSAFFFCLVQTCCRKGKKSSSDVNALELVSMQTVPLATEDGASTCQAAEGAHEEAAVEVEYSDIHFKERVTRSAAEGAEPAETEYAEIKKEEIVESQGGDEEMPVDGCGPAEGGGVGEGGEGGEGGGGGGGGEGEGEGEALYSEVNEVMAEM